MTRNALDDFESPGSGPDRKRSRAWLWLALGVTVGVAGTVWLPGLAGPYLPGWMRGGGATVDGTVVEKQREEGRLLLTVDTDRGAVLATFERRIPELDLLIAEGDLVTLQMEEYRPFVEEPTLAGVWKQRGRATGRDAERGSTGAGSDALPDRRPAPEEAAPAGETADSVRRAPEPDTTAPPRTDTTPPARSDTAAPVRGIGSPPRGAG